MAEESEKTEPATPKKKEDARKKGQVAQSRDVSTVLLLMAATGALASPLGTRLGRGIYETSQAVWGGGWVLPDSLADYHALMLHVGLFLALMLAPFAAIFMVIGIASNVVQIGWMLSPEALAPKFEKMNPLTGLKRMVSVDKLYELAKALLRLAVVMAILWWLLAPSMPEVFTLLDAGVVETGRLVAGS